MDKARLKAEMSLLSELIMHGAREVKCGGCGITLLIPTEQDGYTCDECGFSPNPDEVFYRVVIFDLDGTLTATRSGAEFAKDELDRKPLPGRIDKCRELFEQGIAKAIATNQGGCAYGYLDPERLKQCIQNQTYQWFGIERVELCPHHPKGTVPELAQECDRRKPAPGMLLDLMQWYRAAPSEVLYVGDMESDRQAAEAAGCAFAWASDFFDMEQSA